MSTSGSDRYHHGHLREALVEAALGMARRDGPEAIVLRAATREAGVSPNAAYRHFSDREDLLRAVAKRCQSMMATSMRLQLERVGPPATAAEAWGRLRLVGRCYVEFALAEPGWFRTAFSVPLQHGVVPDEDDPRLFEVLVGVLDDLVREGGIAPDDREGAEFVAWSAVHGIATLLTSGTLRSLPETEKDYAIDRVLTAVRFGGTEGPEAERAD